MERYVIARAGILFQCQHEADSMICFPDDTKGETGTKKTQILPVYTYVATSGNMATLRRQQP